ncbi:hypothetical protein KAU55_05255, partial [Candidatus Bathyarchaeota archaeon]|nr:hypothetical protein [Candidatus Bathyarchaeota archaeon]
TVEVCGKSSFLYKTLRKQNDLRLAETIFKETLMDTLEMSSTFRVCLTDHKCRLRDVVKITVLFGGGLPKSMMQSVLQSDRADCERGRWKSTYVT